ncbi:hypothetical protein BAUCODRAFT_36535 [Baudoinia panamericana UAMH 10762]|uniref:DH domain-containing protein n=1 Tax=Baudoinia panamericana (strain UAMH 10762) TaxID=717646 RepID=M2MRH6_BAUPA|nr:uncharacterized protein BAUCODRAFT_36535 [Baudoinia panamericana UAMH 10762]EMC94063.1 hypothetical protein BAUCODRAFT_36535 [Baudoinia panamericana UAMH 10762]
MSYYQGGQYQQPPPPNQGYYDQYGQYQQPAPGPNGNYSGQYAAQPQYPGQHSYDPSQGGGGPVQQPGHNVYQDSYASPQNPSVGVGYGTQQPYQQPSYNPQHFAPQPPPNQQSIPQYNPAAYVTAAPAPYPQQYTPSAYPEPPSAGSSGPQYGYAPGSYSGSTFSPQQQYQPSPPQQQQPFVHYNSQPSAQPLTYQPQPPQRQQSVPQYPYQSSTSSPGYPPDTYRPHAHSLGTIPVPQHSHYQISPALPGLADDLTLPSPPHYQMSHDARQSPSPLYPTNSHVSLPSPPSITPGPTPPAHGLVSRTNTLDRHPQSRPLPGPPEPDVESDYFTNHLSNRRTTPTHEEAEALAQEELFNDLVNTLLPAGGGNRRGHSPSISLSRPPAEDVPQPTPLFTSSSPHTARNGHSLNGHLSPATHEQHYSDDSDAEATQGLAMIQQAEEEERRQSSGSQLRFSNYGSVRDSRQSQPQQSAGTASDSDDYGGYDVSAFTGPDVQMSYGGNDPSQLVTTHILMPDVNGQDSYSQPVSSQHSSMRRSHASQSSQISRGEYDYHTDSIHPFPPFNPAARVDAGGTGGLSEPTAHGRRQSYDEGDEYTLTEGQLPIRFPDEPPDIFFQQASTTYHAGRPLPAVPGEEPLMPPLQTNLRSGYDSQSSGNSPYPHAPDAYGYNAQGQYVPRSTSLINHQTTPLVSQPLRSKTDAEARLKQQYRTSVYTPLYESTPASSVVPDLPSLGAKRFVPGKLGAPDFNKCTEPWGLMGMLKWLLQVVSPEQYSELKEADVKEALVALFTNKVPTMNIADAEGLSNHVVNNMYAAGTLVRTEEWVKLVSRPMSGVIFQLTGAGCYSPTLHEFLIPGRCYSHHCQRTLKKLNLQTQPVRTSESWAEFYHLGKEDLENRDRKELERQNVLHEIVYSEDIYMEQLTVLRTLYRDTLLNTEPSIITPKRKDKFIKDVFGRVEAIKQANEDHLLPQLKYRQQEQGPWIVGFSDIFRQWIRKAKAAYLEYAGGFPSATFYVRQELDRNIDFRAFIERAVKDPRSKRLGWDTYLKAPITRLQRYTLLLQTVMKSMRGEHLEEEKRNLQVAYDEVKNVTLECDARVAEVQRKVDLADLSVKLVLRPGMQQAVELNLDHIGRQLIHKGDLQRMGDSRFTWLESHALLFDHYLVIAKIVSQRSDQGGKVDKYDVSRLPIPMDLLILESTNDPAVQKGTYVKGITSAVTGRTATSADPNALTRTQTNQSPGPNTLQHVNTSSSTNSLQTMNSSEVKDSDKIMYPFKIKHLGRDIYTLFAPNEAARREWCVKIIEAKTKHAAALYAQHAEPFRLKVMADSAFYTDAFATTGGGKTVVIKGTPVDRAIKEVETRFKDTGRPVPVCRARVNCATGFTVMGPASATGGQTPLKQMLAVGTDFGVYISELENPRGWTKAIPMVKVSQIAVLEEHNLFLLISDKSLIAYHLDVVCPNERNGPAPSSDSTKRAPQKLSGSRDVGFFLAGRMKDRTLLFYKKRENLNSVFKVLEPVYQKSTERRRVGVGMLRRGNTEFFREYDEFYIPAECTGMNLFHSSLAICTARGFEVLSLERKQPFSVPDTKQEHVQNIASHIKDQRALGMLRLSDQEFLLVYSNCAVYVNKHGEVSRSVIMDFVGNAQSAALYGAYLILFDNDFVEIRNAQNGRLKQIIAGREIKCLDDGGCSVGQVGGATAAQQQPGQANGTIAGVGAGARSVKLVMQHPELEKLQMVCSLELNENAKE